MSDNFDIKDFTTQAAKTIRAKDVGSGVLVPHHYIENVGDGDYEAVAASATDQVLGATGAIGDILLGVLIVPVTTSPGTVSIKDGAGTAMTIFTGGADSVSNLVPFFVPINAVASGAGWSVTTGTNVSVIATGSFT